MPERLTIYILKTILRAHKDEGFVVPNGSAIIMLVDEEVYIVSAPDGKNFLSITDEEVNNILSNL